MKGLTQKQNDILRFIHHFIETHHYSPSYREIMQHFAFSSPGSVYKYIHTLKRKGALIAEKRCSRSLTPIDAPLSTKRQADVELPFIGNISAGHPIEMFIQTQTIIVPLSLVHAPDKTYVLRALGDSLNEEAINDGDLLIVEARQDAQAGEMIIALINQHDTVIKRYYPEGQYVRLESHHHQPFILRQESITIQGILLGLIRHY